MGISLISTDCKFSRGNILRTIFVVFFCFCCLACEEEYTSPIPDLPVSISFNLLFEQDLKNLTGFPKIIREQPIGMRQGFGGVLIVHGVGDTDPPLFAFDLACPHEADRSVTVIPDSAGKARCPKCGSVFVTLWGTGMPEGQSVSRYPLKSYRLTIQNTTCLISN